LGEDELLREKRTENNHKESSTQQGLSKLKKLGAFKIEQLFVSMLSQSNTVSTLILSSYTK
jgi:hypothetical protein